MKKIGVFCLTAAVLCASMNTNAAEPYQEYNKRIESAQTITALKDDLMGDSISLYNGATEFLETDISLRGNNELPVALSRRFQISLSVSSTGSAPGNKNYGGAGNWDIDVPYITSTWAQGTWPDARCSSPTNPVPTAPLTPLDVWQGNTVHTPGSGDRKLLRILSAQIPKPNDGAAWTWTTRERDMVRCIPMKSGLPGEGFFLQTANGIKYFFDVATTRSAGSIETIWSINYQTPIRVTRTQYYLLASRVEDRLGNSISYTYNSNGYPTRILSSDGREISLTYINGNLSSAQSNGKSWAYAYGASGADADMLTTVTQPDGSKWQYSHSGALHAIAPLWDGGSNAQCTSGGPPVPGSFRISISHPSGAVGAFNFANIRHARMGVHANACLQRTSNGQYSYHLSIPTFSDVMSLSSKTISGVGLDTRTWNYEYPFSGKGALWGTKGDGKPYPCTTCVSEKTVSVAQPDGTKKQYRYGNLYASNEGRLLGETTLNSGGSIVRVEETQYLPEGSVSGQSFNAIYGYGFGDDEPSTLAVRPVIVKNVKQDGTTYTWKVNAGCGGAPYCFDALARPTSVTTSSTPAP